MIALNVLCVFVTLGMLLAFELFARRRGGLRAARVLSVALAFTIVLFSFTATAATSTSSAPSAEQIAAWVAAGLLVCRFLSNFFPPNTIAYKILHALGAGTGADQAAGAAAALLPASSTKPSTGPTLATSGK